MKQAYKSIESKEKQKKRWCLSDERSWNVWIQGLAGKKGYPTIE